jgi:DTW domain-containing protein YfiP
MRRVYPANDVSRCFVCGTHREQCFCADLPVAGTRTRILFVQHPQEALKPTNSARMTCRILSNASIAPWSRTEPTPLGPEAILLYPSTDAAPLEADDLLGSATIVIPDGTWSQAARISNVLGKRGPRRRVLPPGDVLAWTVRRSGDPERISSGQAAAAALHLAGELDAARQLREALAESQRRILAMRGVLPDGRPDDDGAARDGS